jgi:protein-export membrane protein SecD
MVILALAVLIAGYALAVFLTRQVWSDRDGIRLTLSVQAKDGWALSADTVQQAITATDSRLDDHGVADAEIVADGNNVVATFPRRGLDAAALKVMFGPGEAKTLYVRPVIHAIPAKKSPPSGTSPTPAVEPAQRIADEKELRQGTNPSIQILALQFQATRCGDDDVLAGHDDPRLPLVTCSADGQTVYLLAKSILGGDQIESAEPGTDSAARHVIDLQFDNDAAQAWADFTEANVGTQAAFTVDTRVLSAPSIRERIPNGGTQISGDFDESSARALADGINRGASPVALTYVSAGDEKLPVTMLSMLIRVAVIIAGIGVALVVIGTVVYLLRARRGRPV